MDGLERIIQKISEDAERTSASVIADAERKAAEIIAEAEASADSEARDIISKAEKEREVMLRKAHSSGELAAKQLILRKRVEIIDGVIAKAKQSFLRDDPAKYFDAMLRLFEKYAIIGEVEMIFNDRDIERIPSDFEARLKELAPSTSVIVKGGGSFDGGFLLISEDVVENCTVDALISHNETEIRDELYKLVFTE